MQKPLFPALLIAMLLFAGSCGKDTNSPDSVDVWVVTKFTDIYKQSGQLDQDDDTPRFTGYSFEFNASNLLTIHTPAGTVIEAKWSLHTNDTVMSINMENPPVLIEEMLGSWEVVENSSTGIKLANPNGTAVPDFAKQALKLEFTKI